MSEKKGFILAPSKFGKPPSDEASALGKPKFTGFKQSKLGVLAESKLPSINSSSKISSPNSSTTQTKDSTSPVKAATFSFTPLTQPASPPKPSSKPTQPTNLTSTAETGEVSSTVSSADSEKTVAAPPAAAAEASAKVEFPVFGENLRDKVKNVGAVFGENLTEKVILPEKDSTADETKTPEKETKDLEFSSVSGTPLVEGEGEGGKTLSESAAEYTQQSYNNKRKYEEVVVVTGEEEESNVLKCNVKLYLFDKENKTWTERGRGILRLNDSPNSTPGHIFSRLVMRTHGSLKVVLNTKLWKEMVCEKVNDRNIRISAMDENMIRIFLISCSQKDADTLYHALECRLNQLMTDKEEGDGEASRDSELTDGGKAEEEENGGEPRPKKLATDTSTD